MQCCIAWAYLSKAEWNTHLWQCQSSNILQSYYYAQAMREVKQQSSRHGLIYINDVLAGIVQMQEVGLFNNFVHGLFIDRGPLWFKNYGTQDHLLAFAEALDKQFPHKMLRKRRFMPEFIHKNHDISFKNWVFNHKTKKYQTFIVDLLPELSIIRQNLKQKWRNHLNKSEKNDLKIDVDANLLSFGHFLKMYVIDKAEKRYFGPSPRFLTALAKYATLNDDCIIFNAIEDNETISSVLIFIHGNSATYQAGWSTAYGRDKGGHYRLMWAAIEFLKTRNVHHFDLGGFNDEIEGIKTFKEGLGGHALALIGSYT